MYNDNIIEKSRSHRIDKPLFVLTLLCCTVGAIAAASMQYRGAAESFTEGDTSRLVFGFLISLGTGAVLGAALMIIGHRRLMKLSPVLLTAGLILTALTFTPLGYAPEGSDDRAWLRIFGYSFQPSELLKLCFILSFAFHLERTGKSLNKPLQLMLLLFHAAVPTALVWAQGDQGTALVFVFIALGMLIYAGLDGRLLTAALFTVPLIGWGVWSFALAEHQKQRILSVLDPSRDPMGTGFQQLQARRAFAGGGLLGEGLFSREGDSIYVSQSQNDFVLSYLGRTGGLILTSAVIILLFSLTLRLVLLSGRERGASGLICSGAAALFFAHTLINVSMELGIMPVIGVPLPFISAGGTARSVMIALIGISLLVHYILEEIIMSVHTLDEIYAPEATGMQRARYAAAAAEFERLFGKEPERFFSAPGRTEVGGNHTDHNRGCVLAAGVSLDVIAAVIPADDGIIEVHSEGFPADRVDTADLAAHTDEQGSSAALIRGVASGFVKNGHQIGGFRAYTTSNVLKGSGLSSSAAFEVLIGNILNGLYNSHSVSAVEIAQLSQYAENVYFGKPSGLMDQMASSVGGFITIDFADTESPVIDTIDLDLAASGHRLCIVDTKGSHADLTPEYAAIPQEMKAVASYFGADVLRGADKAQVLSHLPELRERFGDRAVLRALHFYDENERVARQAQALINGDLDAFFAAVRESGRSSFMYLQNVYAVGDTAHQGLSTALYLAESVLGERGAFRVHGGGFAGTIQAFVPDDLLDEFRRTMEDCFGEGSCHVLSIRPFGGTEVDLG